MVTVTVRDQRYREHDPILGVVPIKLSDILETSSQVTRWYPLDGGIGFGRIRISILLRHVETKLPPNMLGWDVGTFEFAGEKIVAKDWGHHGKIRLRTSGSTGKLSRRVASMDGKDLTFDLSDQSYRDGIRLPVKHRYRSPVVFEFHNQSKRGIAAYAVLWLQHLVDNEVADIDIPIWTTKNGPRLTQNYVTEANWKAKEVPGLEDLTEVGRLQFKCVFSPGTDESHERFVTDNDSRETFETWEACAAQGVRSRSVSIDVPSETLKKHEQSLIDGRDVLKQADPRERRQWIDHEGNDWSGAFGQDPRAYTDSDGHKMAEPGRDQPPYDPVTPQSPNNESIPNTARNGPSSSNLENSELAEKPESYDSDSDSNSSDSWAPSTVSPTERRSSVASGSHLSPKQAKRANRRSEQREHRGIMQWKPARNAAFAKDEAVYALRKMKMKVGMGDMTGREPDVETET